MLISGASPGAGDLPAASSLMSSRWSRDNLITGHPARLYSGKILARIDEELVEQLVQELETTIGPVGAAGRMGVYTWDIKCTDSAGERFLLQVPQVLDEPGRRGRARRDVPRFNVENMRQFRARGLTRFVLEPKQLLALGDNIPVATFVALPEHRPIVFSRGSLHVEVAEAEGSWLVPVGPAVTAELLVEMVAALVYHYEPDADGGTALTDVCVNDGDFVVRRRRDGSFEVRLTAARRREPGIGPNLLLLYLIQMLAFDDWNVEGELVGVPSLVGNPSVAFAGMVRGLGYRHHDLGRHEQDGARDARRWIEDFGRSREGRAYRPWVDRFLSGGLPPSFGGDLRERWWNRMALKARLGVLELRARQDPASSEAASAPGLRAFLDRLSGEIGRIPVDDPDAVRINDLGCDGITRLIGDAGVAGDVMLCWPYRSLEQLLVQVPGAGGLRALASRITFGRAVSYEDQGTPASLGPLPADGTTPRPVANAEAFGGPSLPPSLHAAAVRTFPTFEAFMDAALHDAKWGYYAHGVSIGSAGHFNTNPEDLSPNYGRWIAAWAFRFWRDMVARGELSETDAFSIIEFGAGNGRLARDALDAIGLNAQNADPHWPAFAARVQYRIYETSASLRDKQRALLGADAVVAEGDARRPAETLKRDFPGGVRGLVLTNEVPDAFGVHKVVLSADGQARAALVVPRVEASLRDALGGDIARRIAASDATTRQTFDLRDNAGDCYLTGETYAAVMETLATLPAARREELRGAIWFEEAYVPAAAIPALAAHLAGNAAQYAIALAAEESGVVEYVNVHAAEFIRGIASTLLAGYFVTIDYGDTTWGLVQGARRGDFPFRIYGQWQDYQPRPNDPYTAPGTQDMTTDVNFTELARAGRDAGLHVLHYGPERDITGDELPAVIAAAADHEYVAEFLGNPVFKVLVLGTRAGDVFTGPLMTPLPLTSSEQEVPASRRAKIAAIQAALAAAADVSARR